jgi:hypothetical protein
MGCTDEGINQPVTWTIIPMEVNPTFCPEAYETASNRIMSVFNAIRNLCYGFFRIQFDTHGVDTII